MSNDWIGPDGAKACSFLGLPRVRTAVITFKTLVVLGRVKEFVRKYFLQCSFGNQRVHLVRFDLRYDVLVVRLTGAISVRFQ